MPSTRYVHLTGTVGRGGDNSVLDVMAVQHLINAYPTPGSPPLLVDGKCGALTIAAIEAVQRKPIGLRKPDGRMDPGGPTLRALNMARKMGGKQGALAPAAPPSTGAPAAPPSTGAPVVAASRAAPTTALRTGGGTPNHRVPPPDIIRAAQKSQQRWGVRASISIAQWILESGWGRSMPAGSNNPFGIKAAPGQPFVMAATREEIHGAIVHINAPFRAFTSIDEAFDEHGKLLAIHPAYALARASLTDPDAYARALTGHYATDSKYGDKLIAFMRQDDLYQYNTINFVSDFGDPRVAAATMANYG